MKTIFTRTAAMLLSAAACACGTVLPASAVETAAPETVHIKTVCPGYEPLSGDQLYLTPDPAMPVRIELYQHSPERANLLLYDSTLTSKTAGTQYSCAVEPGDYTLRVTYSAVKSSKSNNRSAEYQFTVANADYSAEPDLFEQSEVRISLPAHACKATEALAPAAGKVSVTKKDGVLTSALSIPLDCYEGERGDFNGDSTTDVTDAQLVLKEYVEGISGKKSSASAMQSVICDIDGDGRLTTSDAQYILMFYTQSVAGKTPQWPDGAPDVRYAGK